MARRRNSRGRRGAGGRPGGELRGRNTGQSRSPARVGSSLNRRRKVSRTRRTGQGGGKITRKITRTKGSRSNVRQNRLANGNTVTRKVSRKRVNGKIVRTVSRVVRNRSGKVIGRYNRKKVGGKIVSSSKSRRNVGQRRRPTTGGKPAGTPGRGGRDSGKPTRSGRPRLGHQTRSYVRTTTGSPSGISRVKGETTNVGGRKKRRTKRRKKKR